MLELEKLVLKKIKSVSFYLFYFKIFIFSICGYNNLMIINSF